MAASLALGVRFTAASNGSGSFVDAGAVTGYRPASGVLTNGKTYRYRAEAAGLTDWEWGTGTWNSGTSTLTRTVTVSSTGGTVAFASAPQVSITIEPGDVLSFTDAQTYTTAEQKQALANIGAWDPGDAKLSYRTAASQGWFLCDDGGIGNAASGATTRANADTVDCFTVLYNSISGLVVQDSAGSVVGRGASAAADYAANRRLLIPKLLGRALAIAGSGAGLTARGLGTTAGAETETPTLAKTAAHSHDTGFTPGGAYTGGGSVYGVIFPASSLTNSQGSGSALNIMQPTSFLNAFIKL